jgi:hypothetical protein
VLILSHHPHRRMARRAAAEPLAAALALAPLAAAALWLWPAGFGPALLAALAGGAGTALALRRRRIDAQSLGWCAWEALVLALLLPAGTAWHAPLLMAAGVTLARTLAADREFLPPLNALALMAGAAALFAAPGALELSAGAPAARWGLARGNFHFLTGWAPLAAALLASAALRWHSLKRAMAGWFLGSAALALAVWGLAARPPLAAGWPALAAQAALFAAITLVADPRATPLSGRAQAGAGSVAGIVFALFALRGLHYQGLLFGALAGSLLTPLLDDRAARG